MANNQVESLSAKDFIIIKGAKVHNLKNVDVAIPRNKFIVITGVSGSGKSSLAFDTLYAEGQRRYVESLSSYARQFLGKIDKPDVEYIKGISPAIAIEQKVSIRSSRSTVGTSTEIYDYLKLLYSRIGKTYSPISGNLVKRHILKDVVQLIEHLPNNVKVLISAPLQLKNNRNLKEQLSILVQQGFTRLVHNNEIVKIEDWPTSEKSIPEILIDRIVTNNESEDNLSRIADSTDTAFFEGNGECFVYLLNEAETIKHTFNNRFELDGMTFEEPSNHFFSFNNPVGACKKCEGFGSVIGIDEDLVIPNKNLSVYEDCIVCWKGEKMSEWKVNFIRSAHKFDFPVHKPYFELSDDQKQLLWTGNKHFEGLDSFFKFLESESYKIQYRVMLSRYRGKTTCPDCKGTRLRKDASYVKVSGYSINQLVLMPISKLSDVFNSLKLDEYELTVAKRLLIEIKNRLEYLQDVGLGYLNLNRLSSTLSGGETQRINLATSLGSSLVGSMYILDEPSIGLHSRDTERLIKVLRNLNKLGNTVIVVEHDEDIMLAADQIIDLGPFAGSHGGNLIFQGDHAALISEQTSLTAQYLTSKRVIEIPTKRRVWRNYLSVIGAKENNLKNVDVKFPLEVLTVICGVSGSGKTSLVKKILYPSLKKMFEGYQEQTGTFDRLDGNLNLVKQVEFIDQNPIGKSSRSNPVTYVKAFDEIRTLFSNQKLAKNQGLKPSAFSFNVEGGRCDNCNGEGEIVVEMQFMADVHLKCDVCHGKRFKDEVLEVKYLDKNIADVLDMTIDDALEFFSQENSTLNKKIVDKLTPLSDVGLGYVHLGQSSSTLSGGEAQRIKLASFLIKGSTSHTTNTVFIFDEPTTGLHFYDIEKLLKAFNALVNNGNTLIVIEHNPDVIKCADWVIDLGPEGGDAGGYVVFEGTPEDLVKCADSVTGKYIAPKLLQVQVPLNA